MKKILLPTISILLSFLVIAAIPTEAEAMIYEDTVRLHILAANDTEREQNIKLELRDALIVKYSDELSVMKSKSEAIDTLREILPQIEEFCNGFLEKYSTEAKVYLLEEWYDTRYYGEFALPQGYYASLKIVIGDGEGKNWWCVMYPPMCLEAARGEAVYTEEELGLIMGKYNLKFKVLEILAEYSGKNR